MNKINGNGMGNKARPVIPIMLDKQRNLKLDFFTLMTFEEMTGRNILREESFWLNMNMTEVLTLMWAGIRWEDPKLTFEQFVEIVAESSMNLDKLVDTLNDAIDLAFPDLDKVNTEEEPPLV